MPHVIVKLWPGKSEQQKALLAERIAQDVMVYKPEILDKWDDLYKKPGYKM